MASLIKNETKITLKYPDQKSFTFNKFQPATNDENLYRIAEILNSFQNGPMDKVVKVTTSAIV